MTGQLAGSDADAGIHQDLEVSLRRRCATGLHQDQTPSGGLSDEDDIWSFPADKEGR